MTEIFIIRVNQSGQGVCVLLENSQEPKEPSATFYLCCQRKTGMMGSVSSDSSLVLNFYLTLLKQLTIN